MSTVGCPLCGEKMPKDKYDNHIALVHPDFEGGWATVGPKEIEIVKILDEDDVDGS